MLNHGLDGGNISAVGETIAETIEARLRTGRPLAAAEWILRQERVLGQRLRPRKPGPKPRTALQSRATLQ